MINPSFCYFRDYNLGLSYAKTQEKAQKDMLKHKINAQKLVHFNLLLYLCIRKRNKNKLNPKTRKGTEIMKTTANNTESKKMTLDEEMAMWEARANDDFGKTLKEINEKAFNEWFTEDDENGISSTPISHHITAYALDGNRKHTANVIRNIIEDYDMMEDVKELVKKMMKLAA